MEYLFNIGFLGTRAPYYMDLIIVYLVSLPVLILFSISLASNRDYKLHRLTQKLLFVLTLFVISMFYYGIYIIESFENLMEMSSIGYIQGVYLLVFQTILSIVMMILWLSTLLFAISDRRRKALPGFYSRSHRASGRRLFMVIILAIAMSIYLYWTVYSA